MHIHEKPFNIFDIFNTILKYCLYYPFKINMYRKKQLLNYLVYECNIYYINKIIFQL